MEKTYEVEGMTCVICKGNVEKCLNKTNGVNSAVVNLLENEVNINYDENIVNENTLAKVVNDAGYKLIITKEKTINYNKLKLIISIILTIILMVISMTTMAKPISTFFVQAILAFVLIIINKRFYVSGFKALKSLNPNMDSLVFISSFVSYIYSVFAGYKLSQVISNYHLYFETSAMILVIVSVGKYIEGNAKAKTVKIIRGLATLIPMQANLLKDGKEVIIPISELRKNDVVLVKPGESIPQDGEVIKGTTNIDESMITGESLPVNKNIGDLVIGGTVNNDGTIEAKITKSANMTVLANIINLTKKATSEKIPIERLADRISKYFVFGVMSISCVTLIVWLIISRNIETALNYALSVLVISCPCALGLATPAAIAVAVGKSASNGVLIKKPEVLEQLGKMRNIIFDKTGTLTKNTLNVTEYKQLDDEFINALVSIEKTSNHPIAKAILEKFKDGDMNFDTSKFIAGQGIMATKDKDIYLVGNDTLVTNIPALYLDYAINNNYSYLALSKNGRLLGIVYLTDIVRETSLRAINNLKKRNINPIMCTGDNRLAANRIAKYLGINDYLYGVKPEDKNELVIKKKEEGIVGMVGDGVNDSIALSAADISISIKNASDIAFASSDVILMKNDLNDIPFIYDLSIKTMRIIKQNLAWALFYNAIFIPIAAGVFVKAGLSLNPMIGSATMWLSSMFVLANALRINKVKKEEIIFMNKTIKVEGMMCKNCAKHVKESLESLGCEVDVSLKDKAAYVKNTSLDDATITSAIEDAGYEVKEIING